MTWLKGRKTYLVAVAMIAYAIGAYVLGYKSEVNLEMILEALGLAALRAGVAKS